MKKLIYLSALCLGMSATAFGQAGTNLLYGNVWGSASSDDASKYKSFGLDLGYGYQFDHNWTIGLNFGYGTDRMTDTSINYWFNDDSYRAGLFVRHTNRINRLFSFWLQGELGYMGATSGNTASTIALAKYNGMYASVTPALSLYFHKGWALNFNVGGLNYYNLTEKNSNYTMNGIDFTLGQQASVGVSVNFKMRSSQAKFERHRNRERMENDGYNDWRRERKDRSSDTDED